MKPNTYKFLMDSLVKSNNLCRVGGYRDGGYVLPFSSIVDSDILISGGIGSNARYETDITDINPKIKIIPCDKSFSVTRMFLRTLYHVFKKNIDFRQSIIENISALIIKNKFGIRKEFLTKKNDIESILSKNKITSNKVLIKLDIEGSEYEILESILSEESKITALNIEFHSLNKQKNLQLLKSFVQQTKMKLIFVSINETSIVDGFPSIIELSFTSNKYLDNKHHFLQASSFPGTHKLEYFT